ncbi:MAG: hypothetical protein JW876_02045 [Candidatus Krumholzibacteriota bacterium]|nr:hypothetical protein [Candidatus Krumholzibacteriota bacterium]
MRRFSAAILAASLAFPAISCGGGDAGLAGREPVPAAVTVENEMQMLVTLSMNEARADLLVHMDTEPDLALFPAELEESMRNAGDHLRRRNVSVVEQIAPYLERGGAGNVARMAGMFDRLVWVFPSSRSIGEMPIESLRDYLGRRGWPAKALEDLAVEGRFVTGTLAGVPVTVTNLADLETGDATAILDIDLRYFLGFQAQEPGFRMGTRALVNFLRELRGRNVETSFALATLSTIDSKVPMDIRFFGDAIVDALLDPSSLEGPLPEKWAMAIEAEDSLVAGNFGGAEALYEQLAGLYPSTAGYRFGLAVARGFRGDVEGCREAMLEAYNYDGGYMRGFFQLANVLAANGRYEAGKALVETPDLAKILPPVEMNYQKGVFYFNAGRPFDAITALEKAAQMRPNDFTLLTLLFRAHRATGVEQKTVLAIEKLRRLDEARLRRDMPWVYRELGELYESARIWGNALDAYEIFLEIAPDDSSAYDVILRAAEMRQKLGVD